jgi:hypothetical protein
MGGSGKLGFTKFKTEAANFASPIVFVESRMKALTYSENCILLYKVQK